MRTGLSRRGFVGIVGVMGAAAALPRMVRAAADDGASNKLKILILGGTSFLGPQLVERALARGHAVTLFNRGKTRPELFPDVEKLRGDRDPKAADGLKALEGDRAWDVVIDTSGGVPKQVRATAGLLKGRCGLYQFVSSLNAYKSFEPVNQDETGETQTVVGGDEMDAWTFQTYGPLKAMCERAAEETMGGRATNIRPGLIVGPGDWSGRFTWWPARVSQGGEVLAPGAPTDPIQYIDVRDIAAWMIGAAERGHRGTYNLVGPRPATSIGELLATCKEVSGSDAELVWADAEFLEAQEVAAWRDMPAWLPPAGGAAGFASFNFDRALATGLTFRPQRETVRDTLEWWRGLPEEKRNAWRVGLRPEREKKVLEAWRASRRLRGG